MEQGWYGWEEVKRLRVWVFIVVLPALLVAGGLAVLWGTNTSTAPMVSALVRVMRDGHPVPQEKVAKVEFAYSEKTPGELGPAGPEELQEARFQDTPEGRLYIVWAPYTVTWFHFVTTVTPEYHSLFLRVTPKAGKETTLVLPAKSESKMRSVMVELPE